MFSDELNSWFFVSDFHGKKAVVAEWLRRLTRNQIPSGSVGSNPTGRVSFFHYRNFIVCTRRAGKHFWFYFYSTVFHIFDQEKNMVIHHFLSSIRHLPITSFEDRPLYNFSVEKRKETFSFPYHWILFYFKNMIAWKNWCHKFYLFNYIHLLPWSFSPCWDQYTMNVSLSFFPR